MSKNPLFILFLFVHFFLYGEKDLPLSNREGSAATLIHNAVSAITGDYIDCMNDLVLLGPEPLIFQRFYSSSDYDAYSLHGWRHNHDSYIVLDDHEEPTRGSYVETSGRTTVFRGGSGTKHHKLLQFSPKDAKGYTNFGFGVISGQNHAKNTELTVSTKSKKIVAKNGSGSENLFERITLLKFKLLLEKKANGNQFRYLYDEGQLKEVQVLNKADKVFSWMKFKEDLKKEPHFEVHASDGRKTVYKLQKFEKSDKKFSKEPYYYRISEVISSDKPKVLYKYRYKDDGDEASIDDMHVCKKTMPSGRYISIDYYRQKDVLKKTDFRLNRVKRLRAPAGVDNNSVEIYRFEYVEKLKNGELKAGYTAVYDAYNHKTHYGYTKDHRLDRIEKFRGNQASNYSLYSTEKYFWDNEGSLTCRYISDQNSQILAARTFDYDKRGNVIKDVFYGNLQGDSIPIKLNKKSNRPQENGCHSFAMHYSYSDDGYNLLLEEKEPNGKTTRYSYEDETKLLKSKFILENECIRLREFYEYDENALVTCYMVDDGQKEDKDDLSGVSMRKIRRTQNSRETPVGLPVRIDEFYYDLAKKQEILLKRTINQFDIRGQLISSSYYDAKENFLYSNLFQYDSRGNIILETNAEGNTIERAFNKNNDLIFEKGYAKTSYKNFAYDFMGRLIQIQEFHDDGTVFTTSSSYDHTSNLTAHIDPLGHRTNYGYDEFNRLIKTEKPKFYSKNGELITPIFRQEYDIFGNVISETDASSLTIKKEYNVRGKPIKVSYSDGAIEEFAYHNDGTLRKEIDKKGNHIYYHYDCFKRLLKKKAYNALGELTFTTSTSYNSFHKLSETDAEGNVTKYEYNDAGLLRSVSKNDSLEEFEYDDCQRLIKTKHWTSNEDYYTTISTYDVLDRVIEERVETSTEVVQKCVQFSYDPNGNKTQIIEHIGNGLSITRHYFDSHNKLIKTIDPEGNETHYAYDYHACNERGEVIMKTTVTDPKGNKIETEISSFDKPLRIIKRNSFGQLITEQEFFYDISQNMTESHEKVIVKNDVLKIAKTAWKYNKEKLLVAVIEAFETPDQKITQFKYNDYHEKIEVIKPDGTIIHHTYDHLGRLKTFFSSDHSFFYEYEYDANNNLIKSYDKIHEQITIRTYNTHNQMTSETLGNGLTVNYCYDQIGRPNLLTLPDSSSISYQYLGLYLKQVKRLSKDNKLLYVHEYLTHDLKGHSVEEKQILNGEEVKFSYDLKGRLIGIQSSTFCEDLIYDPLGNILASKSSLNIEENQFTYDDMNQLTREAGAFNHTYLYDSLNNCIDKDGTLRKVNDLNQLVNTSHAAFKYDKNGNRIESRASDLKTEYSYDALDRLIQVKFPEETYHYTYDAFNRRLSKIKKNHFGQILHQTNYLYVGQNEIGAYENDQLTDLRVLGTGKGAEIAAAVAFELHDKLYIPVYDQSGNVVQIKDAGTGGIVESYRYSAFGETQDHSTIANPWQFSSKRFDVETGFTNFGRRYYDPKTGTWISPDPLGLDEGPNLYAFVLNNPLSHLDLYGLKIGNAPDFNVMFSGSFGGPINMNFNFGPLINFIGHGIALFSNHMIPIPVAREYMMAFGRTLSGAGFNLSNWRDRQSRAFSPIGDHYIDNHFDVYINGMNNDNYDTFESTRGVSSHLGNRCVDPYCNQTRGLMTDIGESILIMFGVETESVKLFREYLVGQLNKLPSNGTLRIYAHSMGGLIANKALEGLSVEQLNQIGVHTFGSARIIHNKHLRYSTNTVSLGDPIPFIADPIGCLKGMFGYCNVKFCFPKNFPILDHAFLGGTYESELAQLAFASKKLYDH